MAEVTWGDENVSEKASEVEAQTAPKGALEAGVYDAEIKNAFIRKTDSGAEMAEFEFEVKDKGEPRQFFYSTAVKSKLGKTTYTRDGKEFLLPGVQELIRVFRLLTGNDQIKGETGFVEFKGKKIEALILKPLIGKRLKLGIRQEENFYNGNISIRNFVYRWMKEDGTNEAGEVIEDKVAEWLKKNPMKKSKESAAAAAVPAADKEALQKSGW